MKYGLIKQNFVCEDLILNLTGNQQKEANMGQMWSLLSVRSPQRYGSTKNKKQNKKTTTYRSSRRKKVDICAHLMEERVTKLLCLLNWH